MNAALAIPSAVELLIKLVLVLPYTIFKVSEPVLQYTYDRYINAFLDLIVKWVPFGDKVVEFLFWVVTAVTQALITLLNRVSAKNQHDVNGEENHY